MRDKLKIAIVSDVLGRENNGTTIAAMNLIRSLKAKGHELTIICPDEDKKDEPGYIIMPKFNFGVFNNYVAKNGVMPAKADKVLLEEVLKNQDIVHSMLPFSLGKATGIICKKYGIPLSTGFHMQAENLSGHLNLMNFTPLNRFIYKVLYKRLYKRADGIHYPTEFIRDTFEAVVGKTNSYVISNGVNHEFIYRPELKKDNFLGITARYTIVFTGRYSSEKTHSILIKALKYSKYKNDIQLIFAGDGPYKKRLIHKSRHLAHKPILHFFTRREMVEVLNNATLYVHPAEIEIEAISCLEAISSGLVPVIANSARSATRYFALDDLNLFENLNAKDLASKIDYWLLNPEARNKRRREYQDYTKKFEQEYCMNKMEDMLYELLANGKQGT